MEHGISSRTPVRPAAVSSLKAFTLLELLVVIAIILILIALLFPALGGTRERMNVMTCLHNMQQIATASFTYAADHGGVMPVNTAGGVAENNVNSWVTIWGAQGPKGLDGVHNGSLWPYLKDERIYLCPSYPMQSTDPAKRMYRSYAMVDYMGQKGAYGQTSGGIQSFTVAKNPSHIIFLAEENPPGYPLNGGVWTINDGYICLSNYIDRPATYHLCSKPGTGKLNVVFLDGHGETLNAYPAQSKQDQVWQLTYNWANYRDGKPPVPAPTKP